MSSPEQEDSPESAQEVKNVVARQLVRVREYLTQIQALLQHPPPLAETQPDPAVGPLVQEALGCISEALASMTRPDKAPEGPAPPTAPVASPSSEKQPSKKRKIQAPRRNGYRRRASSSGSRTKTSKTIDDGYSWRKYGQKEIYGAKFSRNYYRCSHKYDRNCQAARQVQRSEEDPSSYVITYLGEHTCTDPDLTCRSPSSQGTACIIDFASTAATVSADQRRQEAPPQSSAPATVPKPELYEEEEISRGSSFTAGSSSTRELPAAFPELLCQLPEAAGSMAIAMEEEKYFAGMTGDECDVTSGWHFASCGSSSSLAFEFNEIPEAAQLDFDIAVNVPEFRSFYSIDKYFSI